MAKLTEQQKLFCHEYLIDLNATASAIRSGYSPKTAHNIGCRILKRPQVQEYLDVLMAQRSKRTGITADRILNELAKIAFVNPGDVIDLRNGMVRTDVHSDDIATIQSVKIKSGSNDDAEWNESETKMYDKLKALELLGKHLGMFKEKIDADVTHSVIFEGENDMQD